MNPTSPKQVGPDSGGTHISLIVAQVLALITMAFGLQFLMNTTGGTLFLFATIGPLLLTVAILCIVWVGIAAFRRRHSLFATETFAPGQIIFRAGDPGDSAYFIRSGEVDVVQKQADGTETVVAKLSRGQYFGEMALLNSAPRNATVRAMTPTEVAVLGKQNFLTMLSLIPSAQQDIMKTVNERAMNR